MIKKILLIILLFLLSLVFVKPSFAVAVSGGYSDNENSNINVFSASTLYFFLSDTSDNSLDLPLFNSSVMQPGLSLNKNVRITKKGQEDFKYNINFSKTSGDDNLCKALQIEVKFLGVTKFNGNLSEFSFSSPVIISSTGIDDWDFKIFLSDTNSDLKDKNCSFDLNFHGFQLDSNGSWGFSDSHSLNSTVSTTTWENVVDQSLSSQVNLQTEGLTQSDNTNVPDSENLPSVDELTPTPTPTLTPTPSIDQPQENLQNNSSDESVPQDNSSTMIQTDEALPPENNTQ